MIRLIKSVLLKPRHLLNTDIDIDIDIKANTILSTLKYFVF